MKYEIKDVLVKELLNYLQTKPFAEVAGLINAFNNKEYVQEVKSNDEQVGDKN